MTFFPATLSRQNLGGALTYGVRNLELESSGTKGYADGSLSYWAKAPVIRQTLNTMKIVVFIAVLFLSKVYINHSDLLEFIFFIIQIKETSDGNYF